LKTKPEYLIKIAVRAPLLLEVSSSLLEDRVFGDPNWPKRIKKEKIYSFSRLIGIGS
jgi:hypothetical protein